MNMGHFGNGLRSFFGTRSMTFVGRRWDKDVCIGKPLGFFTGKRHIVCGISYEIKDITFKEIYFSSQYQTKLSQSSK